MKAEHVKRKAVHEKKGMESPFHQIHPCNKNVPFELRTYTNRQKKLTLIVKDFKIK